MAAVFLAQQSGASAVSIPVVTSISPTSGSVGAGVTIHGSGLTDARSVTFDGVLALFSVTNDNQVFATAPAHAPGPAHVVVATLAGTSVAGPADVFTYLLTVPVVTGVAPPTGVAGTVVAITGTGFTGATVVSFGGVPVFPTVVSDTQVFATAPVHALGPVHVLVTAPGGTSPAVAADQFTYVVGGPVVISVSPLSGTTGTTVVITGTGFAGATIVAFDGIPSLFVNSSSTQITAIAPAHVPAAIHIVVTTPVGTSTAGPADVFTYVAGGPVVTTISPSSGVAGTVVTIIGVGFTGATSVSFGTVLVLPTVVSDTQIFATAPINLPGSVHVLVTTAAGTSIASAADLFTYPGAGPVVTAISPTSGVAGTAVTITGVGFTGATSVSFGGVVAIPTVLSDIQITVSAPVNPAGSTVHVLVTTPSGTSAAVPADLFTYLGGGVVVTSLSPTSGGAGTVVTITGFGFTGATSVTFGGIGATPTVSSDVQIVVVAPAGPVGAVHVIVVAPLGASAAGPADIFTYLGGGPVVTNVSPSSGSAGTAVTITGSGFTGATSVTFGGVGVTPTVVSDTQILAVAPSGPSGTVDVLVITPSGTSAAVAADQFTYPAGAVVYALSFRWSLIAWGGPDGMGIDVALRGQGGAAGGVNDITSLVTAIFRWNAGAQVWLAYFPGATGVPGANDFAVFTQGGVYWIAIVGPAQVTWHVS